MPLKSLENSRTPCTLTGGNVTGSGGAILNRESLTISASVLTDNHATSTGGAIVNIGSLQVSGTHITDNSIPISELLRVKFSDVLSATTAAPKHRSSLSW